MEEKQNRNKVYTHPYLGMNITKGNIAYFDELEKKAEKKYREEARKEKIKFWLKAILYIGTIGNLWFWAWLWHIFH